MGFLRDWGEGPPSGDRWWEIKCQHTSEACLLWRSTVPHGWVYAKEGASQGPLCKLEVCLLVLTVVTVAKEGALIKTCDRPGPPSAQVQSWGHSLPSSRSHRALGHTHQHLEGRDGALQGVRDKLTHTRVKARWSQAFEQYGRKSALSFIPLSDNMTAKIICSSCYKQPPFLINGLVMGDNVIDFQVVPERLYLPFPGLWHIFL